jgi:hypothetical protein
VHVWRIARPIEHADFVFELWHGATSCRNVLLPSANVCRNGETLLLKLSIYLDEFNMPSTGTILRGLLAVKPPQNNFGRCFTVY